ncbi:carbohydrate ABC transporter permease [Allofournierella massiliensis]|uniref:carbohydrate ABC transporter permease n=1 Tax=Allofournierella massiliensis TaxID=1650663 RepID=UPI0024B1BC29|nr:sugar ABC transporter permease [Fournierella massiliensis]
MKEKLHAEKKAGGLRGRMIAFADRHMEPIFIAPAMVVTIVLLAWPICMSIYYSFTNKSLLGKPVEFVGLSNYVSVLQNSEFYISLWNTVVYTVLSLSLQLLFGFIVALALNRITRFKGLFRTLCLIPWAFPMIIVSFTWSYLLNDIYGIVNGKLLAWGIVSQPIQFLADPKLAMITVSLINVWFGVPLFAINILASLQTIPKELYEAAEMDGATVWQRFRFITLPFVRVVVGLLIILRTIWIFNSFDLIFLLTGGGPGVSTQTMPIFAYRMGWTLYSLGRSSAVTILLLIILAVACTIYFKVLDHWESEVDQG